MRIAVALVLCLTPTLARAQGSVSGDWMLTQDVYGNPLAQRLTLKIDGSNVSGTLGQRAIAEGTMSDSAIRFALKGDDTRDEFTGTIAGEGMSGTLVRTGAATFKRSWSAVRMAATILSLSS